MEQTGQATAETAALRKRVYCNSCKRETDHEGKGQHSRLEFEEDGSLVHEYRYTLWICRGCGTGTLEERYVFGVCDPPYEITAPIGDEEDAFYSFSPERGHRRREAKKFSELSPKLGRIYKESLECFSNGALVLCTAGLRALLEGICQDKKLKGRDLKERIDNLEFLVPNRKIIRHLHHFRFTGNKALHELKATDRDTLSVAIDVIETLLDYLYELDFKAAQLKLARRRKLSPARRVKQMRAPTGTPVSTKPN